MLQHEKQIQRLKRKLEKKDSKIKALEKRLQLAESTLVKKVENMEKEVTRNIENVMFNLRFIPAQFGKPNVKITVEEIDKDKV